MNSEVKIIVFHYVKPEGYIKHEELKYLSVSDFRKIIKHLKDTRHSFISLYDIDNYYKKSQPLPDRAVLLTFDDGLKDGFTTIFPILYKEKISGLFFIPARPYFDKKALNATKLHYILASVEFIDALIMLLYDKFGIDIEKERKSISNKDSFDNHLVYTIKYVLQRKLLPETSDIIIDYLFEFFVMINEKEFVKNIYMNRYEIEIMDECCFFGGHGYKHYPVNNLSPVFCEQEVRYSDWLLDDVDIFVKSYSYPHGFYDRKTIDLLKEYGFEYGFTTEPRVADLDKDSPFLLPRIDCVNILKGI